jgi:hypothetical protein
MISTQFATKLFAVILLGQGEYLNVKGPFSTQTAVYAAFEDTAVSAETEPPASPATDSQDNGGGGAPLSAPLSNFLDSTGAATIVDIEDGESVLCENIINPDITAMEMAFSEKNAGKSIIMRRADW